VRPSDCWLRHQATAQRAPVLVASHPWLQLCEPILAMRVCKRVHPVRSASLPGTQALNQRLLKLALWKPS
jgi:hypothetical protein